ncbi:hypothetical protein [Haloarchaeobius sp. HME9146]|uniref:hypothetical protein n=1 Tax=unclassified Haloarchaeobius TaxID=2614452 RepID=UPI0021BFB0FD|nr:hypothetical protein [Haloarchaeobius sp. HME9146]MCT9094434.1 hypothetical protein [Haloarchaeobius sp. HME9146]
MLGALVAIVFGTACCAILGYAVVQYRTGALSTTNLRRVTGPTFGSLSLVVLAFGEEAGQPMFGRAGGVLFLFFTLVVAKDSLFEGVRWLFRLPPEP